MAKYTLNDLLRNTYRYFDSRFDSARERSLRSRVSRTIWTPFVGTHTLSVRAECRGEAERAMYKVIIVFNKVDYIDSEDEDHTVKAIDHDSRYTKEVWMVPISRSNEVRIRCSCLDFYFRSAYYCWKENVLYGVKPKPYKRKTTTWPSVNEWQEPMMCKHLIAVYNQIKDSDRFSSGY